MRGRRFVADLVDLARTLPVAIPLALPLFGLGGAIGGLADAFAPHLAQTLERPFESLLSLELALWCVAVAWASVFVLVRAAGGATVGELVAGLKPPAGATSRVKTWVRALCFFDLPLGWVLPARPIDRALGTACVRDHTRTWLEAVGNTQRKKPMTVPLTAVLLALPFVSAPTWASAMEGHHRMHIVGTISQYDGFCSDVLATPRGRAVARAAVNAEWLAPRTFTSYLPAGSRALESLQQAMALMDGPCGGLRPGDRAPFGVVDSTPVHGFRAVLAANPGELYGRCSSLWKYGYNQPSHNAPAPCGRFVLLGAAYDARTAQGKVAQCGVYASEGQILAVVGRCEQ
jgi:hypothetical protein